MESLKSPNGATFISLESVEGEDGGGGGGGGGGGRAQLMPQSSIFSKAVTSEMKFNNNNT